MMFQLLPITYLFFCAVHLGGLPSSASADETVTLYIVRHADRDGKHDRLTETGKQRAEKLKDLMEVLGPGAVYSTDYTRTIDTAKPTAEALKLQIQKYDRVTPDWISEVKKSNRGMSVLIVGHSNTVVPIANQFGARIEHKIEENEFDNVFVITISRSETRALRLRYWQQK